MDGLPKRGDFQLAWEAQRVQRHFSEVFDHSKCTLAMPCKQVPVRKVVTNPLQRDR